jgi:hypothetical protein
MSILSKDRRSLFLMLSLLLLIILTAFLEHHPFGKVVLLVAVYVILIFAILELHDKGTLRWLAIGVAIPVVFIELASLLRPSHSLLIVGFALFAVFFGFVGAGLFTYLGNPGANHQWADLRVGEPLSDLGDVLVRRVQRDGSDSSRLVRI